LPEYIEISVSDKGSEIFQLDIRKIDSLEINVTELTQGGTTELQGDQYRQLIRSQLASTTNIRGYYPMSISLATSKLERKELTVVFDGEITTSRANLVADSLIFIPKRDSIWFRRIAQQTGGSNNRIYHLQKSESYLTAAIKIKPVEGVKFVPSEVEIYIPIKEFTEGTFEIPITATHLPENLDVKFFPSRVKVSFR